MGKCGKVVGEVCFSERPPVRPTHDVLVLPSLEILVEVQQQCEWAYQACNGNSVAKLMSLWVQPAGDLEVADGAYSCRHTWP